MQWSHSPHFKDETWRWFGMLTLVMLIILISSLLIQRFIIHDSPAPATQEPPLQEYNWFRYVLFNSGKQVGFMTLTVSTNTLRMDRQAKEDSKNNSKNNIYWLLNRDTTDLHQVIPKKKQIIKKKPRLPTSPSPTTRYMLKRLKNTSSVPYIAGQQTTEYAIYANQQLCQIIAASPLLGDFNQPFQSLYQIYQLAQQTSENPQSIDSNSSNNPNSPNNPACQQLLFSIKPTFPFEKGLPIYWHRYDKTSIHLVDMKIVDIKKIDIKKTALKEPDLFTLPDDYTMVIE